MTMWNTYWCLLFCVLLTTCTHLHTTDTITILDAGPDDSVTVTTAHSRTVLKRALSTVQVSSSGVVTTSDTTLFTLMESYGTVLSTLPLEQRIYTFYFPTGKITLTAQSRQTLAALLSDVQNRDAVEVEITGHTDTVGTDAVNDSLSVNRAEAVKALLIQGGLLTSFVRVTGRGSRSPVVETPVQRAEPRNRRVEVILR
jgi:outer membrane protein OmpA-like peptidoglycan-associated protein